MIYPLPKLPLSLPRDTTQYYIAGTDTFRRGHRSMMQSDLDTPYHNFGGNRGNLEKGMRIIWKADAGYRMCQVDQSGAEALVVAHLCDNKKYRSLFRNGIKPHAYLALKLFREQWHQYFNKDQVELACVTPIEQLKSLPFWKDLATMIADSDGWESSKRYYHFAKKTVHAGSYAMRENTFILAILKESEGDIVLTKDQGKDFLKGFHSEFPEIRDWQFRTFAKAKKHKQLRNLFGHPFNITDYIPDDIEKNKDLIAWVPQSTVAEITRTAFVNLYNYIATHSKQWHQLADGHDAYMAESPEAEILDLAKIMKQFIEIEFTSPYDGSIFQMKSGVSIGSNWSPWHEKKNPEGLKEIKL